MAVDNYPQAARKHLCDAMVLEAAERFDGVAYLSGYVVECAAKALIQVETGQVLHTHELDELRESLDHQAGASDVRTARLGGLVAAKIRDANILAWQPGMRYRPPEVSKEQAGTWLREAIAVYSLVIGGLTLDGLIG